jgi:hypothetical protein
MSMRVKREEHAYARKRIGYEGLGMGERGVAGHAARD